MRLGVGRTCSTQVGALVLIVFALVVTRLVSLVLVTTKSEAKCRHRRKGMTMDAKLIVSSTLETAWSIGVSMAGPPLLT